MGFSTQLGDFKELICAECGTAFKRNKRLLKKTGHNCYCSKACAGRGMQKTRLLKTIELRKPIDITCAYCNKVFSKIQDSKYRKAIKRGQKDFYCGRECSILAATARKASDYLEIRCDTCGRGMRKRESQKNKSCSIGVDKFYCSAKCDPKYIQCDLNKNNVVIICNKCNQGFSKNYRDYITRIENGVIVHCSFKCVGEDRVDCKSPFRFFFTKLKSRCKGSKEVFVDALYLEKLWEEQKGICPVSGVKLNLPYSSQTWGEGRAYKPNNASLDRINNNLNYIPGNVRFVSLMTNFAKNIFTDEEVVEYAKCVVEYQKTLRVA